MVDIEETETAYARREGMLAIYSKLKKEHWVTLLLCLTAGWTGAHRFYIGDKKLGIIYLVFGVPVFFVGFFRIMLNLLDFEKIPTLSLGIMVAVISVEIFMATGNTDRANERLKAMLNESICE